MIECDRCGAEFEEQDSYLRHLGKKHADDLSEMEQKRVGEVEDEPFPWAITLTAVLIVGVLGVVLYLVMFSGGGEPSGPGDVAQQPGARGSDHYHGPIEVIRNGSAIDLSQRRYQLTDTRFHLEGGDGSTWHAHATDVSLEYGLKALGFDEDVWVETRVNNESVEPESYILQEGDSVNVTVSPSAR